MASAPKYYDRTMETSTTTGTGTYTLAGAVTGFQSFANVGNGNSCHYCAFEVDDGNASGGWEVGIGTYTTSGTTLSRDKILASSNSGNAVSWSAGTRRLFLNGMSASVAEPVLGDVGGRLTLVSGTSVPTSDQTAKSTIYFTPHIHNRIALYDGSGWRRYSFAEISLALSGLTSGKNYDVFVYDNAGTLTLELSAAWTNDTTRADALATQDGVTVKSGSLTRRWLGMIRTTGTTTTEDSGGGASSRVGGKRFVWNAYNQVPRTANVIDLDDNWTYTTGTIRQKNGQSGNKVEFVLGDAAVTVHANSRESCYVVSNVGRVAVVGLGLDSTTAFIGLRQAAFTATVTGSYVAVGGSYTGQPGLGYHYIAELEYGADGTSIFVGDNANDGQQTGLIVTLPG